MCGTLNIITSLAVNYPILQSWDMIAQKLLVVISDHEKMEEVVRNLRVKGSHILTESDGVKKIQTTVGKTYSAPVIFMYKKSKKSNEILRFFRDFVSTKRKGALTIVVADQILANEEIDAFYVFLRAEQFESEELCKLVPPAQTLPLVYDIIRRNASGIKDGMELSLIAAASFLYPVFSPEQRDDALKSMLDLIQNLIDVDAEARDFNGMSKMYIDAFNRYVEKCSLSKCAELPVLDDQDIIDAENTIFYDTKFLYIHDELFERIVQKYLQIIPTIVLKRALLDANILSSTELNTFSCKMNYRDTTGAYHRKRMLRFQREKLQIVGEIEVIDFIKLSQRGK